MGYTKSKIVSVRMPESLIKWLDTQAGLCYYANRSDVINELLDRAMRNLSDDDVRNILEDRFWLPNRRHKLILVDAPEV